MSIILVGLRGSNRKCPARQGEELDDLQIFCLRMKAVQVRIPVNLHTKRISENGCDPKSLHRFGAASVEGWNAGGHTTGSGTDKSSAGR